MARWQDLLEGMGVDELEGVDVDIDFRYPGKTNAQL